MKYPKFLSEGKTIGVCAPSFGCPLDPYRIRYDRSKNYFKKLKYNIKETESVYKLIKDESAPDYVRAKEFMGTAVRKHLKEELAQGRILHLIYGENFTIFDEDTRRAFARCGALRHDRDLEMANRGVTFVVFK